MLLSQGGQKEAAECGEDPPAWLRGDRKSEKKSFLFFLRILKFFSSVNLHQTDEDFAQRGKRKGLPTFKHKSIILSNFN